MSNVNIGVSHDNLVIIHNKLNLILADLWSLSIKLRSFHWRISGPLFGQLHKFFGDLYDLVDGHVDLIAERILALGGQPVDTVGGIAVYSSVLDSTDPSRFTHNVALSLTLADFETLIRNMRVQATVFESDNEPVTANMFLSLIETYEKQCYFLRSALAYDFVRTP